MKIHDKNAQREKNNQKSMKTASILFLTLVFALVLCGSVSAGTPLAENQTGTVSGDLYVNTTNPWSYTTQGATNEVTQANTLPAYTSIDSAMVYVNVYSGSGTSNWPVRTTIKLDGNGDGDYDDPGELLGVEDMNIPGTTDGTVYWLNDHCNRVYSDYQVWYDVKNLITSNNPTLYVKTENMGGDGYDGRIKLLALTVAYNDGDTDQVHYWVLNGQDWINTATSPSTSTFNTSGFNGQITNATLNTVALSGTDGTYNLNGTTLSGNLTETGTYYKEHQWDVTGNINTGTNTTITYTNVGSSLKMNLATLTIREAVYNGLADTAWPKFGGNLNNTGQSPYNGPQTANILWTYTTYCVRFYGQPAMAIGADGTAYIGGIDFDNSYANIYALNPDGTSKWTYSIPDTFIAGAPAIGADGTIYIADLYGINAINPDGTLKWSYMIGDNGCFNGPAIGTDGTIYITNMDGNLYAINPDGTLKWTYFATMIYNTSGSPAIGADGTIYFANYYGTVYAVNPDGTLKWSYNAEESPTISVPTIGADGTIYIGNYNGNLFAINPDGTLKWSYTTGNPIMGAAAIATDGTIYIGGENNNLFALNPDGTLKWTYTTGSITGSPVIGADGTIYIGDANGTINAINPDGTQKWAYTIQGESLWGGSPCINGMAIGANGTLYIASDDGNLYAFHDLAPVADFTSAITAGTDGYVPLTVQFTDTSSNTPTSWLWDFGDGTTSIEQNPSHIYNNPGTFTVKLTVSNLAGSDDEIKTDYITLIIPAAPVPVFTATPESGITPVTVQFTDQTSGVNIARAWDFNNDGTIDSTLQNPIWTYVTPGNYTVKLTVSNAGGSNDEVKTDYITILADTEAPVVSASPVGGTFTTLPLVSLNATDNRDPNPIIYYTTDNSTPTTTSTLYTVPISIMTTTTVKFISSDMNSNVSPVQTETYTINDTEAPTTNATPAGGTYTSKITVTLSAIDNIDPYPVIYYTTDNSTPTITSTQYTDPISITQTITLKSIAVDVNGNVSLVQTETYTINDTEAPTVNATQSGTTVTLSAIDNADPNPSIYYTTDGTDPTTSSTPYSSPFTIPRPAVTLVKFITVDVSGNTSPVQSKTYSTIYSTDILTAYYAEGNVGVVVDNGGTAYGGGNPTYNLSLPSDATVLAAYLCLAWDWYGYTAYTVNFNGNTIASPIAHYVDGNDGQDVYDVTSYFNTIGTNTATIGHTGTSADPWGRTADYGRTLIVVYQSASEPYREIWVNMGFDIIPVYTGYGATEGPGHAFFNNVTNNNISSAQITITLPSGDNDSPNILLNGQTFTISSTGGSDPAFKYYNITPTVLQNGLNTLEVPNGGYMSLSNAILTLTMQPADLTTTGLTANIPQVGASSPVTTTLTNNGGTDASNFLVKLYDNNIQVAKTTITSLVAGASLPVNFDWTPTTTGNHVLAVIADAGNQITESDETNNLASALVVVNPSAQPDLIATNLMLPVSPVIGTTSPVTVTITNQGAVDSSAFVVKLYDNNIQYATINLTGLAAGASTDVIFDWLTYTTGQHNLSVIADANQQISEYNEANNQISQQATVNQSTLSDISVSNLQTPVSPAVAVNSQVTATVTNLGTVDSGAFVVKLYDNNTQIAKINLTGLAAGTSTELTFNWSTLTSGTHNLSVIADANQQITEYNENNNQISQQATVNPSTQPDLSVTNLQLPANPIAGTTYQITATITNQGTIDTAAFAVKLYDNNTQLGKINITSLTAGTSTQVTFNWTPTTGTHNLAIKADANNQITEYNENNNQITQQTTAN